MANNHGYMEVRYKFPDMAKESPLTDEEQLYRVMVLRLGEVEASALRFREATRKVGEVDLPAALRSAARLVEDYYEKKKPIQLIDNIVRRTNDVEG